MESPVHPEERRPPPWEDDPLDALMHAADHNVRVTSLNLAEPYRVLRRLHAAFLRVAEALEKDNRQELLVPRFLIVRTHSSVFAAMRLAMSGQATESYPVLRTGIEQAWYALHIAKDPQPPERARTWLCRNEDAVTLGRCKTEFTVARVRASHQALDTSTAKHLQGLYERMIDFGAHPNQMELLANLGKSESGTETTFQLPILKADGITLPVALHATVAVGAGALKVFRLIYPERFRLVGLDEEIDGLVADLNTVFKSYTSR